ncbi:MAG: CHAT domain-containing protein, partial [Merismopedia sp. SIO2A8]|nr:CHAT domain-containing protein [Merismopedia sp. SIO2A8]
DRAQQLLQDGLAIAQQQEYATEIGAILFSLGQTHRAQQEHEVALELYQRALSYVTDLNFRTRIELAQLQSLVALEQWDAAQVLLPQVREHLSTQPKSRDTIYAHIALAQQLIAVDPMDWSSSIQLLTNAVETARILEDSRSEAYALGYLGRVYEQTAQWPMAQSMTYQGLLLAQQIKANDIAYQWQWQLGRILNARGRREGAIEAYGAAVNYLNQLRGHLSATGSEEQFRFQEKVEPIYRELVGLLLTPDQDGAVSQEHLLQARDVMESFQIAELDNFFQEACLDTTYLQIDHVDPHAAIIYPILLSDRLEVILSLPDQPLRHFSSAIAQTELTQFVNEFRNNLVIRSRIDFLPQSQQLYDWLIRPMAPQLDSRDIDTLVFVLDGPLRQLPMAALHDGSHYLIHHYQVSTAPGLTLVASEPIPPQSIHALVAGLSQSRHGFSPLSYVGMELDTIHNAIPGSLLFDEAFTSEALEKKVKTESFPLIHIASHGQFSSRPEQTFILAWDKHLNIQDLQRIFRIRYQRDQKALDLLVLSACETAAGDPRAPLGLAGMAVRAGARSTLATLWSVNDGVTAQFMAKFYQNLSANMTKAEALRQSQLWLLQHQRHNHPLYWAPYVLIGSWD